MEGEGPEDASPPPKAAKGTVGDLVAQNVAEITRIEQRDRVRMGFSDHFAELMTTFGGSMNYVWLHVVWFTVWIVLNVGLFGLPPFDKFPFGFLTMIVSLEAIFLSTFVLISENRQSVQAVRRAKVDLQANIIAEQEITKLIEMVAGLQAHLGIEPAHDKDLNQIQRPTYVEELADAVEAADAGEAASRPRSGDGK